jgi:hypothetical protein
VEEEKGLLTGVVGRCAAFIDGEDDSDAAARLWVARWWRCSCGHGKAAMAAVGMVSARAAPLFGPGG